MKKLIPVLLLLIIGESAYAEYITILPVNSQEIADASPEIVTLSELYGKSTTVRYMADSTSSEFIALNNTNVSPMNSLTLTEDVLLDNKLFGFYIGAARQTKEANARQVVATAMALNFSGSEIGYDSTINVADVNNTGDNTGSDENSNVALATLIEEQLDRTSDSDLLSLDTDLENDNSLLADDRTSSLIDNLLPGSSSGDYDLPLSDNNILVSGLGGAILSGGGSGNGGVGFAGGGSPVPEPSTWALLVLGVMGLMVYRKRTV